MKVVADAALTAFSSRAAELTHIQSASSTSMLDTNVSLEFQSYLQWVMIYWACVLLGVFFIGPALSKNKFIVAINWTGITFLDEREKRLVELSFPEVTGVNTIR